MGVCLSCLGLPRRESSSDPSDTHPLLNEPYPPNHYGTVGDNARTSPQVDPEEIRRQRDALERLKLIDVTHTTRSDESRPAVPKMTTDYPRLFAEQFGGLVPGDDDPNVTADGRPKSDNTTLTDQEEVESLRRTLRKQGRELATWKKPANLGSLSIQFDDLISGGGNGGTYQLPTSSSKGKLTL